MISESGDLPSDPHPFLRHSPGPESHNRSPQLQKETALSSTRWSYAKQLPVSDAAKAVTNTLAAWEKYCALALCLDGSEGGAPPKSIDQFVMGIIQETETHHGTVGCRWTDTLYFFALPNAKKPDAHQLANQIQENLAAQRPEETISIGLAPYPLLKYCRKDSWANTAKALAHAAYLGPGSIVELDAVTLNISGDHHFQSGATQDAIAEYRAALALDPQDANVLNSLGVCLAEVDDISAAKQAFNAVTEIQPAEPMAHYNLGMLYLLDHRAEEALPHFQKAHAANHEFFEIPLHIGLLFSQQCRWEDALDYAEKALALNPEHGVVYGLKGLCLAALEKTPEAIAAYTRSVKINPNNAEALSALGCLYDAKNENPDICRSFLEQSVALAPNNGLFHFRLGRWHQKHLQFEEAKVAYQAAIARGHDASRQMEALKKELITEKATTSLRTG